jgi:hypothetical protein
MRITAGRWANPDQPRTRFEIFRVSGNAGPAVQKLTRSASGRALWEPPQAHFPWDAAADHAQARRTPLLGARLSVLAMSDGTELGPNRTSVARRAGRLTVWAYSVDAQEDPPGAMRKVAWPRNRLGRKPEAIPESLSVREIIKDLLCAAATGRTARAGLSAVDRRAARPSGAASASCLSIACPVPALPSKREVDTPVAVLT